MSTNDYQSATVHTSILRTIFLITLVILREVLHQTYTLYTQTQGVIRLTRSLEITSHTSSIQVLSLATMAHSNKNHKSKSSSKKSKNNSTAYSSSSSKPSYSSDPTPLDMYLGSGQPHERVAVGRDGGRQSGQQMVQQFDGAWSGASGRR
ncbi:hypothetical protein F5Y07DRAFT_208994 [Xylaria sp. FL0933]|nr:hypothetical protein F5Y07DRAFT_208994 [Xylaria sp. FL0933]